MSNGTDLLLLLKAAYFASEKHRTQRRKDAEGSPYINHPLGLAKVLAVESGITDPTVLMAALLHDTVEDTETTYDELSTHFGDEVCKIVREVSDDKTLPKQERKRLQIEHAKNLSNSAKLVKIADKICNLRDIVHSPPSGWSLERKLEYFDWADKVVAGCRGISAALEAIFDEESTNGRKRLSTAIMPHEDTSRAYWKYKEGAQERYERMKDEFSFAMKLRQSSNPVDVAFYNSFIAPDLGPKPLKNEDASSITENIHSFIDKNGDEIRLSITYGEDVEWEWRVERFTQGKDDIWYPAPGDLELSIRTYKLLHQCAIAFSHAVKLPFKEHFRNIATVELPYWGHHWYVLMTRPYRKSVECIFQHVCIVETRHIVYPYNLSIDSESLPDLLIASEILIREIEKLLSRPKWKKKRDSIYSLDEAFKFRLLQ